MENYQKPKYNKNELKQELTVLALIVWSPFTTSCIHATLMWMYLKISFMKKGADQYN